MKKGFILLAVFAFALSGLAYADNTDVSGEYLLNRTFRNDTIVSSRKVVTTAGTPVALSTTQRYGTCTICAETDNTGMIVVGSSTVDETQATRTGVPLSAGSCYTLQTWGDLADIYIDSGVNGDGVTFLYTN